MSSVFHEQCYFLNKIRFYWTLKKVNLLNGFCDCDIFSPIQLIPSTIWTWMLMWILYGHHPCWPPHMTINAHIYIAFSTSLYIPLDQQASVHAGKTHIPLCNDEDTNPVGNFQLRSLKSQSAILHNFFDMLISPTRNVTFDTLISP